MVLDQRANHLRIPEGRRLSQREEFPVGYDKCAERVCFGPSRDQERLEAAGHLDVGLQCMEGIGSANGNDDDFEFIGEELEEIERPTLLAVATGEQVMDLVGLAENY